MRTQSNSRTSKVLLFLSEMLMVEFNKILNPVQEDNFAVNIKYRTLYTNLTLHFCLTSGEVVR